MDLTTNTVQDILVVGLAEPGELEASNVGDFRDTVSSLLEGTNRLLVDMINVTFLDSSGLRHTRSGPHQFLGRLRTQ